MIPDSTKGSRTNRDSRPANHPQPDSPVLRLAMWSGPRNLSTALMRSFGNRTDTHVCDEPLYAHYLAARPKIAARHPIAAEILEHEESQLKPVLESLLGALPRSAQGSALFYQKHMAHHLLPEMQRDWWGSLTHAFLIRDPAEVLLSLSQKLEVHEPEETGLPQQLELFQAEAQRLQALAKRSSPSSLPSVTPPVIDARDLLKNPVGILTALCQRLGIEFSDEMLKWEAGPRSTDGCWGPHWYENTLNSTGFLPYRPPLVPAEERLPAHLLEIWKACRAPYEQLYNARLRAD